MNTIITTKTSETTASRLKPPVYIGIDYHKRYSVYCAIDEQGGILERGRIEHQRPEEFAGLVKRWEGCRIVYESSMNWHWLYEVLEEEMEEENIVFHAAIITGNRVLKRRIKIGDSDRAS